MPIYHRINLIDGPMAGQETIITNSDFQEGIVKLYHRISLGPQSLKQSLIQPLVYIKTDNPYEWKYYYG